MLEDHLKPKVGLWLHIAVGVFLGTTAANLAMWGGSLWMAKQAAQELSARLEREAQQLKQSREAEREAKAQADAVKRQQATDQQQAREQRKQQADAEAERRELAWTRFYQKPPACDEARGGAWTVDCANGYMRARARFAEMYDAGKL